MAVSAPGYKELVKGRAKGGVSADLYFSRRGRAGRVIVFDHIRKTAGTALRHLMFDNLCGEYDYEVVSVDETPEAWTGLWSQLGWRRRRRLVAVASHGGRYLLPMLENRARPFTLLRDPVDRAVSRYYFFRHPPEWTLESLYRGAEGARTIKAGNFFFNGQARHLLSGRYDISVMPLTADQPDAELWLDRLADLLDSYLVGVQERMDESVIVFAELFGWEKRNASRVRVTGNRPRGPVPAELERLARRFNWLDEWAHRAALAQFG